MLHVLGFILLLLAWVLLAAINHAHKDETGVSMPSRSALKSMRRRARKKGVSEAEYYAGWVQRKQKREGVFSTAARSPAAVAGSKLLPLPPERPKPERLRAPPHEPFSEEHLSMMAAGFGWTLRRQAFGKYFLVDIEGSAIVNPFASVDDIATDFSRENLEDLLLTC